MEHPSKTAIVYVDGFNLYYSLFRTRAEGRLPLEPRLKWLDPYALASVMLPHHGIVRAEYFTARIKASYARHGEFDRQRVYLGALESTRRTRVTYGKYEIEPKWLPLTGAIDGYDGTHAKVLVSKEKKSDVNLACQMMLDAMRFEADMFVLVSNDSDFRPLLEMVSVQLGRMTGLLCPSGTINAALADVAKLKMRIKPEHIAAAQLPDCVTSLKGKRFERPPEWA